MPRPKKETAGEPKKRSRTGCWPCKARKVKCGEEKPQCANCVKSGEQCDYSIRLNWGGRGRKDQDGVTLETSAFTFVGTPTSGSRANTAGGHEHIFSAQHIATAPIRRPASQQANLPTPDATPSGDATALDPQLRSVQQRPRSQPPPKRTLGGPSYPGPSTPTFAESPDITERSPAATSNLSDEFRWSPQHGTKRMRLSPPGTQESLSAASSWALSKYASASDRTPGAGQPVSHTISSVVNTPATPGSSIASGSPYLAQVMNSVPPDPPDLRRLSVRSLLSDPWEETDKPKLIRVESNRYTTYGYDHGLPDMDVPRNDDRHALLPKSPDMRRASTAPSETSSSSGEPDARAIAFEPGGYYVQPVAVRIPRFLEPLSEELINQPMNLLYFHHFINHTGRIMVPHDCPENPFRGILPLMAMRNRHLLHLVLTYSASHRANLLGHPEPVNRIAAWMTDVVPALRQALSEPQSPSAVDPRDPSSLAPLATAIMLASLEIVSPHRYGVAISWQHHLQVARQMIVAKGGLHHLAQKADGARDKAIFFLSRWFAYLDVLGSLSGSQQDQPLYGAYLEDGGGLWLVNRSDDEIYQIDCFFGFSGRCIALLAQVAELAAQCDKQRIDPITNQIKAGWRPSETVRVQAAELQKRLVASAATVYRGCTHSDPLHPHTEAAHHEQDVAEIYATNEAFHWAGLIHLAKRVLALPATAPEVQENVRRIIASLQKVRRGSTAEPCLLFPMFSAGCEAQTPQERRVFMERLQAIEGWGLQHVGRARKLMQEVWDTGRAWETLVNGEFFG